MEIDSVIVVLAGLRILGPPIFTLLFWIFELLISRIFEPSNVWPGLRISMNL